MQLSYLPPPPSRQRLTGTLQLALLWQRLPEEVLVAETFKMCKKPEHILEMSGRIWPQFRSMELAQRGIMVGPSIVQYNDSPHGWCLACWVHLAFWTFKRRAHQQNQFNFTFSKGRYLHWQAYNTNQVFNGNQGSQDSSDSQCFTFASLNQLLKKRKYLQTSKKPVLEKSPISKWTGKSYFSPQSRRQIENHRKWTVQELFLPLSLCQLKQYHHHI